MAHADYPLDRSVEISKMRRLMSYGLSEYKEDWQTCVALAVLMANDERNHLHLLIDSAFKRIQAFGANNQDVLPFDYLAQAEGAYDDMGKLISEWKAAVILDERPAK